ncbi:transposase [Wukongibacter sp. M2B1]|uniref:transposase n=1 Tax=Wukongibacter sp. M2B1 TaxID=3088895 RepID=UPI003D799CCB
MSLGDRDFYGDKFKYNKERDFYTCPAGQKLTRMKHIKENPVRVRYRNYNACGKCEYKDRCTKSKKGREINRSKHQDFLDIVDARTKENMAKYLRRQMIVEHPFGTIKRAMNCTYFLIRELESVGAETFLIMLSYNSKKVINILGVAKLVEKIA